ncbi:MAG: RluA family pseudouridine synthase [Treponema sp.]|nr:RluA family pseudouridine synthase [Treponema sp.]
MFPPFKEDDALKICKLLSRALDSGLLELRAVDSFRSETERTLGGIMLGVLIVSENTLDGNKSHALVTVSGTTRAIFKRGCDTPLKEILPSDFPEDWGPVFGIKIVAPIVSASKIDQALLQNDKEIHELTKEIAGCKDSQKIRELKLRRTSLTDQSLLKVFDLYSFHCADGKIRSLKEICTERNMQTLPPTGTGECCAPKLLDYAFASSLQPLSLCEAYYQKGQDLKPRTPCDERCGIILPSMLGLELLYRDEHIAVINKPSGLLSIPGRGIEKLDSVTTRLKRLFPACIEQPSVHRLDMETSGLMVLAFTKEAHRILSRQFMEGQVSKKYTALLDGVLAKKGIAQEGCMELYFRLDVDNRPHQIWDSVYGKKAVTSWRILDVERYTSPDLSVRNVTRVEFVPHTGRTHQLRLASADSHGFGIPIIGDTLYGKCAPGERLMLHACHLEFVHPVTNESMVFESKVPF